MVMENSKIYAAKISMLLLSKVIITNLIILELLPVKNRGKIL
jgi:hypothetical protein